MSKITDRLAFGSIEESNYDSYDRNAVEPTKTASAMHTLIRSLCTVDSHTTLRLCLHLD